MHDHAMTQRSQSDLQLITFVDLCAMDDFKINPGSHRGGQGFKSPQLHPSPLWPAVAREP